MDGSKEIRLCIFNYYMYYVYLLQYHVQRYVIS